MKDTIEIKFTSYELQLLISGLSWMAGEAGDDDNTLELRQKLRDFKQELETR